jgi:hypothetical protein
MKKQTIYYINKQIPKELVDALCNAIDKKDHASYMIKSYTDDWVTQQKKIIELNEAIKKIKAK